MPAVRGVQKVGQAVGEELAATMMGQRPNTMMSKVVPQPLFAVPPEQGLLSVKAEPIESLLQTKPQAPVSDIGFYSATEQAALNLGRNKGTGQSFINDIMKAPDVKKEELQFTGLEDFLTNKPNVTKQEVQDFLANNRVDVKEVTYGNQDFSKFLEYNRQDTMLLVKIHNKLKFLDLANQLAHENTVLLPTVMGSVAMIEMAVYNEAHRRGFVVPDKQRSNTFEDKLYRSPQILNLNSHYSTYAC
jgi:hypothetical protein